DETNVINFGGDAAFTSYSKFGGDVIPSRDNAYKLGGDVWRWSQVWATNGILQTSDLRMKKDVCDLRYGLGEILKLRPVSFRWKTGPDTERTHLGLVAQEVEKVLPELVVHGDSPADPLGMDYAGLIPVLVKAVQAQQREIEEQDARVARLER